MYSMILPVANAKVFVDQIFRIFDKDGNGDIDFKVNYIVLKPCSQNIAIANRMFYIVKIGPFGQFKCKLVCKRKQNICKKV